MTHLFPWAALVLGAASPLSHASPTASGDGVSPLPRAEQLLGERRCVACHAASPAVELRLVSAEAPLLAEVGARVAPSYLADFLADPSGTRPGTRMPDVLSALESEDREAAVTELVHFLAGLGGTLDLEPIGVLTDSVERGRRIYHSVGCVACHRPQAEPWELEFSLVDLEAQDAAQDAAQEEEAAYEDGDEDGDEEHELYVPVGTLLPADISLESFLVRKTTVSALAGFLEDPLAVRPSGHMPDLSLTHAEALDTARYLLRGQADGSGEVRTAAAGLISEYFEEPFTQDRPNFDDFEAVRREVVPGFSIDGRDRDDGFGFRFSGILTIPETGEYTFTTTSDDGSQLWLDGEHVIDNGGQHGMQEVAESKWFEAGRHTILVTMYERGGGEGLQVTWEGPGIERQEIPAEALSHWGLTYSPVGSEPFEIDPDLALAGRERFVALGCAACHTTGDAQVDRAPEPLGAPLMDLDPSQPAGCLGTGASGHGPRVVFDSPGDLAAVRALVTSPDRLEKPLDPEGLVGRTLARLRCYSCHRRDEVGGVHPLIRDYFLSHEGADLGDEGRIPPPLTRVGAKLKSATLEAVLLALDRVRPYMAVRMPSYGEANVGHLVSALAHIDKPEVETRDGLLAEEEIEFGRRLAGIDGGLGCIQCHDFAGTPSLGIRAVDLSRVYERLNGGWFRELLFDPASLNMNTRMPLLWTDGRSPVEDIYDGDPARQIAALWAYLSLGSAMPAPPGLIRGDEDFELVAGSEPVTCGVFMKGVSPRTVVVGFPVQTHYAFDVESPRLAKVWRGRFFNARGTWEGRAGQLESPPSDDVLDLPAGPAFARLSDPGDGWPADALPATSRSRRFDAERRPTFVYVQGEVTVEETPYPVARFGGSWLVREFRLVSHRPVNDLWFRPFAWKTGGADWRPPELGPEGELRYSVGGQALALRIEGAGQPMAVIEEGVELLIPVRFVRMPGSPPRWEARFKVEISW